MSLFNSQFFFLSIMRKYLLVLIILKSTLILSQETEFTVFKYKVYTVENNELNNKNEFFQVDRDTMLYKLYFNGEKGLFTPVIKLNNSQEKKIDRNEIFQKAEGDYYFDNTKRIVENQRDHLGKKLIIEYPYDKINWEVTEDTDSINGFFCRKAIYLKDEFGIRGEKKYLIVVWYVEDGSISIAPFGLMGLNGLVVKAIYNNSYEVAFDGTETVGNNVKNITNFKNGERVSLEEYNQLLKDFFEKHNERRKKLETDI